MGLSLPRLETEPVRDTVTVDLGGPENLTLNQFARAFEAVAGQEGPPGPRPAINPAPDRDPGEAVNPAIARVTHDAIVMDTIGFTFDASPAPQTLSVDPLYNSFRGSPSLPQSRPESRQTYHATTKGTVHPALQAERATRNRFQRKGWSG